jgi:hypothetical protein
MSDTVLRAGGNPIGVRRDVSRSVAIAWRAWRELRTARRTAKHARLAERYPGPAARNGFDPHRERAPYGRIDLSDPPRAMAWSR